MKDKAFHEPAQGRPVGARLRARACDATIFATYLTPGKGCADNGAISETNMKWVEEKCVDTGGRST
eukprot:8706409-Pyramimonas_sp.AAC.1